MTGLSPTWTAVLGWTLVHFLWQGTALAIALAMALTIVPRRFARVRYALGCSTLALMLAVPTATAWRLSDPQQPASPLFEATRATAVVSDTGAGRDVARTAAGDLDRVVRSDRSADPAATVPVERIDPSAAMPWIVAVWMMGVLLCSLRLAGGWWHARRLAFVGAHAAAHEWQEVVARLKSRLGVMRSVRLLESARVSVPIVVGWIKPTLIVPAAVLGGLAPSELEAVLAHELAHIRRHDYLVNLLQSAVETLLFYHPGVWWVSHVVRVEREHCCDDLAVKACGDAVLYARALTAIELMRHDPAGSMAMAVTGSPLLARVRRLLGVREPARLSSSGWVVAILTVLMVSGAGVTSWVRGFPLASFAGEEIAALGSVARADAGRGDAIDASGRCHEIGFARRCRRL